MGQSCPTMTAVHHVGRKRGMNLPKKAHDQGARGRNIWLCWQSHPEMRLRGLVVGRKCHLVPVLAGCGAPGGDGCPPRSAKK